MLLTIFTPTYNRAEHLGKIYESLKNQHYHNFEWLIIDDGSTDNTKEFVNSLQVKNNPFIISYYYKENGGKHSAINLASEVSKGTFMLWLDSDDFILPNSLDLLIPYLLNAENDRSISAVVALRLNNDDSPLGNFITEKVIDVSFTSFSQKNKITGDYSWVFKNEILKKYPFPIYSNENFCLESIILNRISEFYKTRFIPIAIIKGGYNEGGLTDRIHFLTRNNPLGFLTCYREIVLSRQSIFKNKLKYSLYYWFQYKRCNSAIPSELKPTLFISIFKYPSFLIYNIIKIYQILFKKQIWK